MKTYIYSFDPLKPHFYIVKLGFTGLYIIFLIFAQKQKLWVLGRAVLTSTHNMCWVEIWNISEFLSENFQSLEVQFSIYLNRHVFVMMRITTTDKTARMRRLIWIFTGRTWLMVRILTLRLIWSYFLCGSFWISCVSVSAALVGFAIVFKVNLFELVFTSFFGLTCIFEETVFFWAFLETESDLRVAVCFLAWVLICVFPSLKVSLSPVPLTFCNEPFLTPVIRAVFRWRLAVFSSLII